MKNFISIIIILFLFSCQKKHENKFPTIEEFNTTKKDYKIDTIELENISSEGGELISYHNNSNKLCLDFFIYGETGKLNYTYFTDEKLNIHFAIKRDYKYDRSITDENLKIDSTVNFISYENSPKLYDKDGNEIVDEKLQDSLSLEMKEFLKQIMTNNVKINK